jgi:hypothetical protein
LPFGDPFPKPFRDNLSESLPVERLAGLSNWQHDGSKKHVKLEDFGCSASCRDDPMRIT